MRVLMIGDVVGDPGLDVLEQRLPGLIERYSVDFTVVNGENAAGGFGLTEAALDRILAAGADAVTGGNHIWEKREFWPVLDGGKPVLRPANYPSETGAAGTPGRGWLRLEKSRPAGEAACVVVNLQGRKQMTAIDCPFRCFDGIYAAVGQDGVPVLVDFHAESSEEKEALGYYLDGRAGVVAGTHTHVQTADERILPYGTGYITDLGMTGVLSGIIGMDTEICLNRTRTQIAYRMECAKPAGEESCAVQGILAELDEHGKTLGIQRLG